MKEFYTIDDELWCKTEQGNFLIDESSKEVVQSVFDFIKDNFKDAYDVLMKEYSKSASNVPYYKYLVVRRFCKCNFGNLDFTAIDIDNGSFNFEKVPCPLRGECKLECVVCMPTRTSNLSNTEKDVMQLYYEGRSIEEIAEIRYKSVSTIKNQVKSVYRKLGVHDKAEFVKYVVDNHLFNN